MWKLVEVLLVDRYQTFMLLVVEFHLVALLKWSETPTNIVANYHWNMNSKVF